MHILVCFLILHIIFIYFYLPYLTLNITVYTIYNIFISFWLWLYSKRFKFILIFISNRICFIVTYLIIKKLHSGFKIFTTIILYRRHLLGWINFIWLYDIYIFKWKLFFSCVRSFYIKKIANIYYRDIFILVSIIYTIKIFYLCLIIILQITGVVIINWTYIIVCFELFIRVIIKWGFFKCIKHLNWLRKIACLTILILKFYLLF